MSDSKFVSHADYWKDQAERAEAKLAELEGYEPFDVDDAHGRFREAFEATLKYGNWPLKRKGHGYRSPMTQMAWDVAFGTVNRLKLCARPVPSEDSFVTVTTTEDGRRVMVSRQDEDHRILKVLWEAKDVPTEPVTVAFGKRGKNMFFKIGNQSFLLDYKPEEQAEFDFMKEMLLSAFYRITQGVKTEIQPVNARLLEAIKRLSFCAQTTGGTAGRDEGLCAAIGEAEKAVAAAEAQQKRPSA